MGLEKIISADMGNIWNTEQWTSHIIPIEDVEQANLLLLWDIDGNCVPIAFPYNG